MDQVTISDSAKSIEIEKSKVIQVLLSYGFYPLRAGLFGFSAFFTAVLIAKYIGVIVGSEVPFSVDLTDVLFSSMGFFLVFSIRMLENFTRKR